MNYKNTLFAAAVLPIAVQLFFSNCTPMNASRFKMDSANRQSLVQPLFNASAVDREKSGESEETDSISNVDGTVRIYEKPPYPPRQECSLHTPGLDALRDSIKTKASAADQDTQTGELKGCEAGLVRFSAVSFNANGTLVNAVRVANFKQAHLGLYCPYKNDFIGLLARFFKREGLRGQNITATYICTYNSNPANCGPNSPDLIGGFEYGKFGGRHRVSNVDGITDADLALDSDDLISRILLPNKKYYSGFDYCNKVALWSPLVIETKLGRKIKTLDPRDTQTYFDLSGTGFKNRISCVKDGAFLVLPNASGRVENINQLFGNNTVGPDGQKADNGFLALGKHDLKGIHPDFGVISEDDRVFDQLKLWADHNCDGEAQPAELAPLSSLNIIGISWLNFVEMMDVDLYGNQTRQRSLVYTTSGRQRLRVFDLWFRSLN